MNNKKSPILPYAHIVWNKTKHMPCFGNYDNTFYERCIGCRDLNGLLYVAKCIEESERRKGKNAKPTLLCCTTP